MPRPAGSKVIPCPTKKCDGQIVALPGKVGTCKYCGETVRITKKLLRELGKI